MRNATALLVPIATLAPDVSGPHHRRRVLAMLAAACAFAALLRVAQPGAGHPFASLADLLGALRWRIWDWAFWIPAAPVVWHFTRRGPVARAVTATTIARCAAVLLVIVVAHRLYSLAGMWLFVSGTTRAIFTDPDLLSIAPIALTDALTFAAVAGIGWVIDADLARRARIMRRRQASRASGASRYLETPDAESPVVPPAPAAIEITRRVMVRSGRRQYAVELAGVHWIEADGYCSRLHDATGVHVVRISMAHLESTLDPDAFVRVHRSAIANVAFARELRQGGGGLHALILCDGTPVPVSRARYGGVRARFAAR
jgi:DNA-binding LytR/AlgR family response regulator